MTEDQADVTRLGSILRRHDNRHHARMIYYKKRNDAVCPARLYISVSLELQCSDWKKIHRVQPAGGIAVQLYILTGYKSFNSTWFIGINAIKTILHDCIIVCCIICLHSGRSCTVKFMLKHIWVIYISHYPYLQWVGMLNVAKVGCVTASFFLFSFFS